MRKSAKKTMLLAILMISFSAITLFVALKAFGEQSREVTTLSFDSNIESILELPSIEQSDYDLFTVNNVAYTVKYQSYMLSAEDAVVFAVKQVEEIASVAIEPRSANITLLENAWSIVFEQASNGKSIYQISIDNVTGAIRGFSSGFYDIETMSENPGEDAEICKNKAIEIAKTYFTYDDSQPFVETDALHNVGNGIMLSYTFCVVQIAQNSDDFTALRIGFELSSKQIIWFERLKY